MDGSYPHEGSRASTEYPVCIADLSFAPRRGAGRAGGARGDGAFDVVVEALDDVAGAGLFEVLRLDAEDGRFELFLGTRKYAMLYDCPGELRTRLWSMARFFWRDSRKSRRRRS